MLVSGSKDEGMVYELPTIYHCLERVLEKVTKVKIIRFCSAWRGLSDI